MEKQQIGDSTDMQINLRWFLQIMVVVGIAVWGYFGLTERITFLEHNLKVANIQVDMNSEFRIKWPRGELGALPDDAEQNMRLDMVEKTLEKVEESMKDTHSKIHDLEDKPYVPIK
jgi:hypothetical protein